MIYLKTLFKILLLCSLVVISSGCFNTKYVDKQQYLFNIEKLAVAKKGTHGCSVFVHHLGARAPFDNVNFLYRVGPSQYRVDYYHSFLTAPTQQIEPVLFSYFKRVGGFLPSSTYEPGVAELIPELTQCYADYRDTNNPRAVLGLHFVLEKQGEKGKNILMDQNFRVAMPITEKTTDALMTAWNQGLEDISRQTSKAVGAVLKKEGCR